MLRYLVAFVILIHGLIHLIGFSKAMGYIHLRQFSIVITKPIGMLWLLAAVLFIATAFLFVQKNNGWWWMALPAVVLSQILVINYWSNAKYGTIANLLIILLAVFSFAEWRFNKKIGKEVASMWLPVYQYPVITNKMIDSLPVIVQKWMQRSGVIGKQVTRTVRLKQKGMMRTKPGGKWMDFKATQYFTVSPPAFNWQAKIDLAPFIYMTGRDKYDHGKGEMLIQLMAMKTIVDSKGSEEIDQGTLLRYLAEICWFPSAALDDHISWEAIDEHSAKATIHYNQVSASGIFFFNRNADMIGFEAMRYGEFDGKTSLEKWHIESKEFKEFNAVRIPYKSEVTWKLKSGDFTWLKLELLTIEYNKEAAFK